MTVFRVERRAGGFVCFLEAAQIPQVFLGEPATHFVFMPAGFPVRKHPLLREDTSSHHPRPLFFIQTP